MNTYHFSMQKVLELRVNNEKTVMGRFANLQNELHQFKLTLTSFINELEDFKVRGQRCTNIYELKQQLFYKQNIEEKINEQNELINKVSIQLELVRLDLLSAQKDRKIMEKLKENDFITYKDELKNMEQKELDEIAILKFNRI